MECITFYLYILISIILTQITEQGKPNITEHPTDAYGLSLQRVSLRCVAQPSDSNITWYKEGQVVESYLDKPVTSNRLVKKNKLLFLNLDTQDEGIYYCNASNKYGWTRSKNATVRIAFLEKDIVGPESKTASVGETVLLQCKAPEGIPKPKIFWEFNGSRIETSKRIKILPHGYLRIDKASRADSGRYKCLAKNFANERESTSAMLKVRQKPYFKEVPGNIEVRVNEAAIFICVVEGDPKPTIIWRRGNNREVPSARMILLENGLKINKVQLSDAGNYICRAKNSAGTIEAVSKLTVISSPGFLETPENQEARIGDSVRFTCRVTGSPRPTVVWAHNGDHFIADETVSQRSDRIRVDLDGSLVISPVKISDSGKYECKATSYNGKIQSSAYLTVKDSIEYSPPLIMVPPQNQTLRIGLTATFYCKPSRPNLVTIVWFKNGNSLNYIADPRIINLNGGILKINQLRNSDAGDYTCRAILNESFTVWSANLRILDKNDFESQIFQTTDNLPSIPTNFEVIDRGDSWINLKWDIPPTMDNSENGISHYMVQYYPYKSRKGWFMTKKIYSVPAKIDNLSPNTGYKILVRAVSELGTGKPNVLPSIVFTMKKQDYSVLNYNQLKLKVDNVFCDHLEKKSVSTDQIALKWRVGGPPPALRLLSGFESRYKRVPLSRCAANSNKKRLEHCSLSKNMMSQVEREMENSKSVLNREGVERTKLVPMTDGIDSDVLFTLITDLKPFVCYEIYIKPYLDHPKFGRLTGSHSNSVTILTYDSAPTSPPSKLSAKWLSNTSIYVKWAPPDPEFINGILTGYSLHILGNTTNSTRSIEVSPRATHTTVRDLNRSKPYVIHLAGLTCQGEGVRSGGLILKPNVPIDTVINLMQRYPNLKLGSRMHDDDNSSGSSLLGTGDSNNRQKMNSRMQQKQKQQWEQHESVTRQPWFISIMVIGGLLWILVCSVVVLVCRGMYIRGLLYKSSGYSNGTKLLPGYSQNNYSSQHIGNANGGGAGGGGGGATVSSGNSTTNVQQPVIGVTANNNNVNNDSIIMQPLISGDSTQQTTLLVNSADVGNSGGATGNSNNVTPNNNNSNQQQRRFHDSVSSNTSSTCQSGNSHLDKQLQQRMANMYNNNNNNNNNVTPYATTSLLQQCIGISTKNNTNTYNYPMNGCYGAVSHPLSSSGNGNCNTVITNISTSNGQNGPRNILVPNFPDGVSAGVNTSGGMSGGEFVQNPLLLANQLDWMVNNGQGGNPLMLSPNHVIPPPPAFPPPPAPISPTASNSTNYYHMQSSNVQPMNDDGGSYASCPIEEPSSMGLMGGPQHMGTGNPAGSIPSYLWSNKHNGMIPVPGYIDYSCTPFNGGPHQLSDNGSLGSSFALPPPHDMLSLNGGGHYSGDESTIPFRTSSNGCIGSGGIGVGGGNCSGAGSSGGGSHGQRNDSVTRSLHDSSLLEEMDERDDEMRNRDCDNDVEDMDDDDDDEGSPVSTPDHDEDEDEAPYDVCPSDDNNSHFQNQSHHQHHRSQHHQQHQQQHQQQQKLFPPPPPPPLGVTSQSANNYPPTNGQLNSPHLGHFLGYLGETPIV